MGPSAALPLENKPCPPLRLPALLFCLPPGPAVCRIVALFSRPVWESVWPSARGERRSGGMCVNLGGGGAAVPGERERDSQRGEISSPFHTLLTFEIKVLKPLPASTKSFLAVALTPNAGGSLRTGLHPPFHPHRLSWPARTSEEPCGVRWRVSAVQPPGSTRCSHTQQPVAGWTSCQICYHNQSLHRKDRFAI